MLQSDYERLATAARAMARAVICYGSGPVSSWGHPLNAPSGKWWVVKAVPFDELKRVFASFKEQAPAALPTSGRELVNSIENLLRNILYEGTGPIAPTFDECDRDVEYSRGDWYVVDEAAFLELKNLFN